MNGPIANIIIPEVLNAYKFECANNYLGIKYDLRLGDYFKIDNRAYRINFDSGDTLGSDEDKYFDFVEKVNWKPAAIVEISALQNELEDRKHQAEVCIYLAELFEGLIFYDLIIDKPRRNYNGYIFKFAELTVVGITMKSYVCDPEFMREWLEKLN